MKHKTFTLLVFGLLLGLFLAGCSPDYAELSWKPVEQPTEQAAQSPFGPEAYDVTSLEVFKDQLYAGLVSGINGARIFRTDDGKTWEFVSEKAFGYPLPEQTEEITYAVWDLQEFQDQLYAGVTWYDGSGITPISYGAQVWRTSDGAQWENVVEGGFGDPEFIGVTSFAVFEDQLYAAIDSFNEGFQVWRSPSGDPGSWSMVAEDSLGYPEAQAAFLTPFKDKLVLVSTMWAGGYASVPVRICATQNGKTWTPATTDGFGVYARSPIQPVNFKDTLYIGAVSKENNIWSSKDGVQWSPVQAEGFESPIYNFSALFTDGKILFTSVTQGAGINLYYSADGKTWTKTQEASHGYNNTWGIGYNPTAVYKGDLYFGGSTGQGTSDDVTNFAQVWRLCVDCE
jgi:photosystem II stability/assembly factor-like uncharacterized protein